MLRATSNMLLVRADLHLTSLSLTIVKFFLHALPFDDEQSRSRKPCFKQHVARIMLPRNMLRWCKRGLTMIIATVTATIVTTVVPCLHPVGCNE